jgi:NTE family protein
MSDVRIGLALGGGSARGLAHIAMLEVFDELGLRPAVIAGCSIGALVGAGYAGGLSARELRERAELLLGNRIGAMRYVMGQGKFAQLLAMKGIGSMHLKGETLAALVLPDTVPELIEDMPIRFKAITTNFDTMEERVFDSGPLIRAVAASIAIPGVILGPTIDGQTYVDGGITNPVPFDRLQGECDLVVAVDVTGRPREAKAPHRGNMELAVGSLLIMFHQVAMLKRERCPPDIYVEPSLGDFSAGDFFRLADVLKASEPAKDELKRALEHKLKALA